MMWGGFTQGEWEAYFNIQGVPSGGGGGGGIKQTGLHSGRVAPKLHPLVVALGIADLLLLRTLLAIQ